MKRPIIIILLLLVISFNGQAQTFIGVVDYLKVADPDTFMKLEEEFLKIHEERMKKDAIIGWAVYKVMFKTPEDPYNYLTITWYDSFSKLDDEIPDEIYEAVFPGKGASYGKELGRRRDEIVKRMSSGVFHRQLSANQPLDHSGNYFVIDEINVNPGSSDEFLKMLREIYKPVYEEAIRQKKQTSWSLWAKWPGNMRDYQYVSSGGYENLDQADKMIEDSSLFKSVHPDIDLGSLKKKMDDLSTKVNSEIWKLELKVIR